MLDNDTSKLWIGNEENDMDFSQFTVLPAEISIDGSFKESAFIPKVSEVDMDVSFNCLSNSPTSPNRQKFSSNVINYNFAEKSNVEVVFKTPTLNPKPDQIDDISFGRLKNLPNLSNNVGQQIPLQNVVETSSPMDTDVNFDLINDMSSLPCINASYSIKLIAFLHDNKYGYASQSNSATKHAGSLKRSLKNTNKDDVAPYKQFCK